MNHGRRIIKKVITGFTGRNFFFLMIKSNIIIMTNKNPSKRVNEARARNMDVIVYFSVL